ncbi:MAG: hypothetical protein OQK98_03575 [Gammaproteobacteria bacterium]|nr:hypothetical protein [Gammaproteobacteria bacterium]
MNKSASILIKVTIFGLITALGIIYVFNRSSVDSMSTYEKREMVKPNREKSVIDQFFSDDDNKRKNSAEDDDDISLMGTSGRYDEVRIGGSSE